MTNTKPLAWYESLVFRLYRTVILVFFLVVSLVTSVQLFWEYQNAETQTLANVEKFYVANANSLSEALWTFDERLLNRVIQGMQQVDYVKALAVYNDKGEVIKTLGNYEHKEERLYKFPIFFTDNTQKNWEMGRIEIILEPKVFLQTVTHGFYLILANYLTSFLIFFIIFTFAGNKIIGRPLKLLASAAASVDLTNMGKNPVNLKIRGRNELTMLEDSFNNMISNLRVALDLQAESENKVHLLLESAPIGMCLTDVQGKILLVNPQVTRLFGHPKENLQGRAVNSLWTGRILQFPITQRQLVTEVTGIKQDGTLFPLEISITALEEEKKTQTVAFRDLTIIQHSESLAKEKDQAIQATKAKSQFLANMSHEIRTPLNAVLGLTHLVVDTNLDPQQKNYINQIEGAAQTLLSIVNDILDFSKIEAGKMRLESHPFRLNEVLENIQNLLAHKASEKALELSINKNDGLPKEILGDSLRLSQVLINLTANAIKFTQTGKIVISTKVESSDESNVIIGFYVLDTGIGISADQKERIFDSFSQADDSTTRRFGGTGLGLSISSKLTEMMGGRLEVESFPGAGSTFYFKLPFRLPLLESVRPEKESSIKNLGGSRILVVEDNPVNRLVIREILKKAGAQVMESSNGQEAVDYILANPESVDMILMDIQMPIKDGYEATQELRAHKWSGPIIAVTANSFNLEKQRCIEAGMQDHISKPIKPDLLINQVGQWLRNTNLVKAQAIFKSLSWSKINPSKILELADVSPEIFLNSFVDFINIIENEIVKADHQQLIEMLNTLGTKAQLIGAEEITRVTKNLLDQLNLGQYPERTTIDYLQTELNQLRKEILENISKQTDLLAKKPVL